MNKYCDQCGSPLADNSKFCGKCGATAENATKEPKVSKPLSKLFHWYIDGFMEDPFWWSIGTCVVIAVFLGACSIGPCSGWLG